MVVERAGSSEEREKPESRLNPEAAEEASRQGGSWADGI